MSRTRRRALAFAALLAAALPAGCALPAQPDAATLAAPARGTVVLTPRYARRLLAIAPYDADDIERVELQLFEQRCEGGECSFVQVRDTEQAARIVVVPKASLTGPLHVPDLAPGATYRLSLFAYDTPDMPDDPVSSFFSANAINEPLSVDFTMPADGSGLALSFQVNFKARPASRSLATSETTLFTLPAAPNDVFMSADDTRQLVVTDETVAGDRKLVARLFASGAQVGADLDLASITSTLPAYQVALASDGSGGFAVCWAEATDASNRAIRAARLTSAPSGPSLVGAAETLAATGAQREPAATYHPTSGRYVAGWIQGQALRASTIANTAWGAPATVLSVSNGTLDTPALCAAGTKLGIAYQANGCVYLAEASPTALTDGVGNTTTQITDSGIAPALAWAAPPAGSSVPSTYCVAWHLHGVAYVKQVTIGGSSVSHAYFGVDATPAVSRLAFAYAPGSGEFQLGWQHSQSGVLGGRLAAPWLAEAMGHDATTDGWFKIAPPDEALNAIRFSTSTSATFLGFAAGGPVYFEGLVGKTRVSTIEAAPPASLSTN